MPQDRPVVLNYDGKTFGPSPAQVPVQAGDTIKFRLGPGTRSAQPNARLRITIHQGTFFNHTIVQHGQGQDGSEELSVLVLPGIPTGQGTVISSYRCEAIHPNGDPIPGLSADGKTGGEIIPDKTGAA